MATVLVVDDEFGIVDVLETILTDEGYRVLTACNGKQGLVRLSEEKPEVILLDFMMPILGGGDMLRAMAAEPAYQRIPVIMMSSLRRGGSRRKMSRLRRVPAQALQGDRGAERCRPRPRRGGNRRFLVPEFRAAQHHCSHQ